MAKNNFDDFLLDPSYDDLDSVHLEAERQLYRKGGFKKIIKKVKNKLTKKGKKGSTKTIDAQAAEIEKIGSTNPKGSQQMGKPTKDTPKKASTKSTKKPGDKLDAPKPKVDKSKIVKTPTVKKTIKKVKTKRGTGVTYKAAWDADKNNVKSKYKTYAEFETAAKKWNAEQDNKAAVKKAKSISPEQRKKNQKDAMDKHNKRLDSAKNKYTKPVVGDEITLTKKDSDRNEFYAGSTSIRKGDTKVKEIKKKGTGGKKKLSKGGSKRIY